MKTKKFFIRLSVLIILVVAVDFCIGIFLEKMYLHPNNKLAYAYKYSDEEVAIFGSSRAVYHYVPSIISDSLNTTVFNFGCDGQALYHNHAIFTFVTDRYAPKIIIFDVFQPYFIKQKKDIGIENDLFPFYYKKEVVKQLLDKDDKYNKIKGMSSMYRYNSEVLHILNDVFSENRENGYISVERSMADSISLTTLLVDNFVVDSAKLEVIDDIIKVCNNKKIKLFFTMSPIYYNIDDKDSIYLLEAYLKSKNISVLNYMNYDKIMHPKYFRDKRHLNNEGAHVFTSAIISDIKKELAVATISDQTEPTYSGVNGLVEGSVNRLKTKK